MTDALSGNGHPKFRELMVELWQTKHVAKAAGYGDGVDLLANLRGSVELGIPSYKGAWIRALDKRFRISRAFTPGLLPVAWAKVRSDLLELAAYCILIIILFEEEMGE